MADYELIYLLMNKLPKDGTWTRKERDKFMQAYIALVDLLTKVVPKENVISGNFTKDAKVALTPFVDFWHKAELLHLRAGSGDIAQLQKMLKKFPLRHFEFAKQVLKEY